ncbi:hypothetical protein, partial [Faecalibaculum rodentium]|uniref:hypothetical protein n=1 Tax=Faecalibaculum rodentium TaxID=1702221 RepID=UPI0025A94FC0
LKVIPQVVFIMAKKKCLENTNGISRHFFPFITRKMGCNQPTDRKTGLTVTAPVFFWGQPSQKGPLVFICVKWGSEHSG